MLEQIKINQYSSTPIYKQIVNSIIRGVENKVIVAKDKLPSINEVSAYFDVGRGTVEKAYKELKENGFIEAVHGKGYYISHHVVQSRKKIFLLFNKLSAHKKIIYDSFVDELGEEALVDFFVYHNNLQMFRDFFENAREDYTHYVIIPHFYSGEEKALEIINQLPKDKLLILDKNVPGIKGDYAAVYQNFEKDIYGTLNQASHLILDKYKVLKIIFPPYTYHPRAILSGFQNFCVEHVFPAKIVPDIEKEDIQPGDAFITLMEDDLVTLIKRVKNAGLHIGTEVGILSYNDNPLKEILLNGISVMSTDFEHMGRTAARMVLDNKKEHQENPFSFIPRQSL